MSPEGCERWRGDLAMAALGRLEGSERRDLTEHLNGCHSCRNVLTELESTVADMRMADPTRVDIAPALRASLRGVARAGGWQRLRRARLVGSGAAILAVAAAVALFWLGPRSTPADEISLHGSPGVQATAALSPERWGTELALRVTGQTPGTVYHVSMESRSGTWWQVGSYRATRGALHIELACGIAADKVERIWVQNSTAEVVLRGFVN